MDLFRHLFRVVVVVTVLWAAPEVSVLFAQPPQGVSIGELEAKIGELEAKIGAYQVCISKERPGEIMLYLDPLTSECMAINTASFKAYLTEKGLTASEIKDRVAMWNETSADVKKRLLADISRMESEIRQLRKNSLTAKSKQKNNQRPQVTEGQVTDLIAQLLSANLPAEIPPTLYINHMTRVQYGGAVSMAREGMRLFYGDMDAEAERLFEARWRPVFEYPSQESVNYLNQLNPLLVQFLTLRASLNDCLEDFNATQLEVQACSYIGDAAGVSRAMEFAVLCAAVTKALNTRLQRVGKEIAALGDPPNAAALMKKARDKHERICQSLSKKPGNLFSITPALLNAAPGKEYTFTVKVGDSQDLKNSNISFKWFFDDDAPGWGKPKDGLFTIKKAFSKEEGQTHKLTVSLESYPGPKTLGTLTSRITMVKDPGCWTLVEVSTEKGKEKFMTYDMDPEAGRIETSLMPPSFVPQTMDRFNYLHTWVAPPQRLYPGAKVQIPVTVKRLFSCDGLDISTAAYSKLSEAERSRLENRKENCERGASTHTGWRLSSGMVISQGGGGKGVSLQAGVSENKAISTLTVPVLAKALRKQKLWLTVEASDDFFYNENAQGTSEVIQQAGASVLYGYQWDATGGAVKPIDPGDEPGQTPVHPPEDQTVDTQDDAAVKADRIAFHQHNIDHFTRNIEAIKKQLKNETSVESINQLTRDLLYAKDARQRELDAIAGIKTGQYVRTRTELDALNMKMMADESRKLAAKWHTINRIIERGPVLIDLAPEDEQEELRKFFNRHVTSENVVSGNVEKLSEAIGALGNRVLGQIEAERAAHEEAADYWNENLEMAQYTKSFADYSMMALSFTGSGPTFALFGQPGLITASGAVYSVYRGITGYAEGNFTEAVSSTLAGFNMATTIIDAGMQGYQAGVLQHLKEYAENPQKIKLDEERAGFKGAAWSAGTAAAMAVAVKFGMHAYQKRQQQKAAWQKLEFDLKTRDARLRHFRRRYDEADLKIKMFEKRRIALSRAGKAGASQKEIKRLRGDLDAAYKDIKTDYFAKNRMKALAREADFRTASGSGPHKTVHAYNSVDQRYAKQLQKRLKARMIDAGVTPDQKYKTFSNSASRGGVGMDIDMGADIPPRFDIKDGKKVISKKFKAWRKNLTRKIDGKVRRITPEDLQKVGQEQLKEAFKDVFGRESGEAMVEFTTTYHPEAYRDVRWLGKKGMKTACAYDTDPEWTQQAADVTDFKVNRLPKDHPSLGYYGTMQENCRGLAKDMKTKLQPLLKEANNPEAAKHLKNIQKTMEQFSRNEIGPLEAERRLRILTGNADGVVETSQRFSVLLQGLKKQAQGK